MANLRFPGRMGGPETLTGTPQNFTANWVDLGNELAFDGAHWVTLWVELDINGTTNARVRLAGRHVTGGDDYPVPTLTVGAAAVNVQAGYYEFTNDADQFMPLGWELDGTFPFGQFQISAGAVGAPAGQIDSAVVTTGV